MDVKKIRPDSSGWDASVEQEIFGNQTPYASESNSRFPNNNPNDNQVHPPQNLDPNLAIDGGSTPYLARPYIPELGTPNSRAAPAKINEHTQESLPKYSQEPDSDPIMPPGVTVHAPNAPLAPSTIPQTALPSPSQPTEAHNTSQWALQSEQQHQPSSEQEVRTVQPQQEQNQRSFRNIVPLGRHAPAAHTISIPSSSQSPPLSIEQASLETLQSPQSYGAIAPTDAGDNQQLSQQPQQQQQRRKQHQIRNPTRHQSAKSNRGRHRNASGSSYDSNGSEVDEPLLFGATKASRKRSRRGFYKSFVILVDRFGWVLLMVVAAFMLLNRYLRPLIPEDACMIAARDPPEIYQYQFAYSPDLTVVFKLLDGIAGDVTIIENETWDNELYFVVEVSSTSSSKDALDLLRLDAEWPTNLLYWTMILKPANGPLQDQRELLQKSCTRTNMTLVIPKDYTGLFKVVMETSQGNAKLLLGSRPDALIGEVQIKATDGNIFVDSASVKGVTELTVRGNGAVSGKLITNGSATVAVEEGWIDIEVDTDLDLVGSQVKDLALVLSTKKGPIKLVQTRRFDGRFDLSSGLGNVVLVSHNQDKINYTVESNEHYRKGWITKDGSEPTNALSSIKATAGEGPIHVIIQK